MMRIEHAASALLLGLALVACGDDTTGSGGAPGTGAGASASTTGSPASGSTTTTTSTTTSGDGGGGSGPQGSGGDGGQPDLDKDPDSVTESEDCYYEGGGGDNSYFCYAAVVTFSVTVPREELTFRFETSEGDVFEEPGNVDAPPAVVMHGDPAEGLDLTYVPRGDEANEHYDPEWVDVEVRRNDVLVGAERFYPEYACVAHSVDDWCWESEPVTLEITNPEVD